MISVFVGAYRFQKCESKRRFLEVYMEPIFLLDYILDLPVKVQITKRYPQMK